MIHSLQSAFVNQKKIFHEGCGKKNNNTSQEIRKEISVLPNSFCKKLDCWVLNVLLCYASQSDFTLGQRDTPSENIPLFSFGGIKIVTWHYGKRGRFLIDFIFLTFLISWLSFSYLLHLLVICIINSTTLIHFNRQTGEQGGSEEFSEIMHRTQLNNHNVFVSNSGLGMRSRRGQFWF